MIFKENKISPEFHSYRQAEMDELLEDYLLGLSEDEGVSVSELADVYGFKCLNYMIFRFKSEVRTVWRENASKNIRG